jgi:SAM-dependent methyltransferase
MSCNVCGHVGRAYYSLPDPTEEELYRCPVRRETLQCHGCGCTMRTRTLAAGLLDLMADRYGVRADTVEQLAERWPSGVRVLDTETGSVLNDRLAGLPGYLQSVYLDGRVSGERVAEGVVNVDLQSMPFPDASFDLIITTEVMEHVRHVDVAHREIARCLAPGGSYLFTVPYDHTFARTWVLIDPVTDEPLVLPMHLHGDPLRGQIKSYRVFGRDLVDDLRAAGLDARLLRLDRPSVGVFGGDVFVAERVARPLQIDLTDGREAAEVRQGRPA